MRGKLTDEVRELAKEKFEVDDFTVRELRLLPYIQHVMINDQKINPVHINQEEREILSTWKSRGWMEGGMSGLAISQWFWNAMNDVLWASYVDIN